MRIFDALVAAAKPVSREVLADMARFTDGGGYFARKVGELRTAGLVEYPGGGLVMLSEAIIGGGLA